MGGAVNTAPFIRRTWGFHLVRFSFSSGEARFPFTWASWTGTEENWEEGHLHLGGQKREGHSGRGLVLWPVLSRLFFCRRRVVSGSRRFSKVSTLSGEKKASPA